MTPRRAPAEVFWAKLPPRDHALQVYANKELFLDALEGFVSSGLRAGEGVVVVATQPHRTALERRLRRRGFDLAAASRQDRYVALDAEATLARFMVNNWPDEARFEQAARGLMARARGQGRRVRAFGEMVALLWEQGRHEATMRLEQLWTELCAAEGFPVFCAYPESCFTPGSPTTLADICAHHSRVIAY